MTSLALRIPHVQVPLGPTELFTSWLRSRRVRQELLALDDEQLLDVGLSRDAVLAAANKPFWSA